MPTTANYTIDQYEMAQEYCRHEARGDLRAAEQISDILLPQLGRERFEELVEYAESRLPKDATDGLFSIANAIDRLAVAMENAVQLMEWRNESYDQRTQAAEKRTKALEENARTKTERQGAIWPN
jgi:hypothetical protein